MADNPNRDTSRYIYDGWEQVFVSILQLLDDYEHYRYSLNISIRENVLARIESVVVAIQQVLSSPAVRSLECAPFLEQLLRNVCGLFLDWTRCETVSQCTDVAVYALQSPSVIHMPTPGRPEYRPVFKTEYMGGCSDPIAIVWFHMEKHIRDVTRRRVIEYGIQEITGYSDISDEELDTIIQQFIGQHGSLVDCSIVSGHLRSKRQRVRESIARVDPTNSHIRWAITMFSDQANVFFSFLMDDIRTKYINTISYKLKLNLNMQNKIPVQCSQTSHGHPYYNEMVSA